MKRYRRRMLLLLAGLLLAVLLEGFGAYNRVRGGYGERDRELSLSPVLTQDYEIEGQEYRMAGAAPQMIFHSEQGIGSLDLSFGEILKEDLEVLLYYEEGEHPVFDRMSRVQRYLMQGTDRASLLLPPGNWTWLRLDIRGDFVLESCMARTAVLPETVTAAALLSQVSFIRLFLLAVTAAAGFLASWGMFSKPGEKGQKANGKRRMVYLDAVRILAAVLVILVHVTAPVLDTASPQSSLALFLTACINFGLTCNLLFFLLSGALLLPYRAETAGEFIQNRIVKVVLPLLVYSFFYIRLFCASCASPGLWCSYAVRTLITGHVKMAPHFWLVYRLIGVYIAAWPLRCLLKNRTKQEEQLIAFLALSLIAVRTAFLYQGRPVDSVVFFLGWPAVFLMGYFLTRDWMRRLDGVWLIGGVTAFAASVRLSQLRADYQSVITNQSLFMLLMAGAVFVLFLRMDRFLRPLGSLLAFLSRYSYSVLLIHWYVLFAILYNGWFPAGLSGTLQLVLPIPVCLVLSFLLAAAVDHTVLAAAEAAIRILGLKKCQPGLKCNKIQ